MDLIFPVLPRKLGKVTVAELSMPPLLVINLAKSIEVRDKDEL
jgi:hypothetical protein